MNCSAFNSSKQSEGKNCFSLSSITWEGIFFVLFSQCDSLPNSVKISEACKLLELLGFLRFSHLGFLYTKESTQVLSRSMLLAGIWEIRRNGLPYTVSTAKEFSKTSKDLSADCKESLSL